MAATMAAADIMHLRAIFTAMGMHDVVSSPTRLWVDNHAACCVVGTTMNSKILKHMARRWYYVRELVSQRCITVPHVRTGNNISDIFTKPLTGDKFHTFSTLLMQLDVNWL